MFSIKRILSHIISDDDAPKAKKSKLESNSTKKSTKKPSLNFEILEEVFVELFDKHYNYLGVRNSKVTKNNEKFMASGAGPFKVALNCFKKIQRVDAYSDDMWVYPPPISGRTNINVYPPYQEISYDFVFLKPTLKAIRNSIKNLHIIKNSNAIRLDDALPSIYKTLITEGLETVHVSSNLPEKYVHAVCNISTIKEFNVPLKFSDLSLIQFRIPKFSFSTDFKAFSEARPQKICLPWIEELKIRGSFEISNITEKLMQSFVSSITEIFPNLKEFKAYFECKNSTWKPVYTKMKKIQPKWLNGFSASIKGEIEFYSSIKQLSYKVYSKYYDQDNEYIIDIGRAVKEFNIHDGLSFEFQLRD